VAAHPASRSTREDCRQAPAGRGHRSSARTAGLLTTPLSRRLAARAIMDRAGVSASRAAGQNNDQGPVDLMVESMRPYSAVHTA
jgi:hypothetical protein